MRFDEWSSVTQSDTEIPINEVRQAVASPGTEVRLRTISGADAVLIATDLYLRLSIRPAKEAD